MIQESFDKTIILNITLFWSQSDVVVKELSKLHQHHRRGKARAVFLIAVMDSGADSPRAGKTGLLQSPSWDGLAILVGVGQEPEEWLAGAAPSLLGHVVTATADAPVLVSAWKTLVGVAVSAVQSQTLLFQGAFHGREGRVLPHRVEIRSNQKSLPQGPI